LIYTHSACCFLDFKVLFCIEEQMQLHITDYSPARRVWFFGIVDQDFKPEIFAAFGQGEAGSGAIGVTRMKSSGAWQV
jgi:hypothetical protein